MLDAIATTLGLFGISRAEMVTGREDDGRLWDDGIAASPKAIWYLNKLLKDARPETPEQAEVIQHFRIMARDPKITRQMVSEAIDAVKYVT